jgi:preprotein translocase subunit YajC
MEAIAALLLAAVFFVPFYVMIIRPHRLRMQEHESLVAALQPGDDVMTTSGLYGTIRELHDEWALLEVAPGVSLKVARRAIGRRLDPAGDAERGAA